MRSYYWSLAMNIVRVGVQESFYYWRMKFVEDFPVHNGLFVKRVVDDDALEARVGEQRRAHEMFLRGDDGWPEAKVLADISCEDNGCLFW